MATWQTRETLPCSTHDLLYMRSHMVSRIVYVDVGLIRLHCTSIIVINDLQKSSQIYPYPFKLKSLHMQNENIPAHLYLKDMSPRCCLSLKSVLLADPACEPAEFKVEGRSLPNSLPSSSLARICPVRS